MRQTKKNNSGNRKKKFLKFPLLGKKVVLEKGNLVVLHSSGFVWLPRKKFAIAEEIWWDNTSFGKLFFVKYEEINIWNSHLQGKGCKKFIVSKYGATVKGLPPKNDYRNTTFGFKKNPITLYH